MNKFPKIGKCVAIAALLLIGCISTFAGTKIVSGDRSGVQAGSAKPIVTPVTGESWLTHLNRPFNETSMGKTWRLGPPAPVSAEAAPQWQAEWPGSVASQTLTLHGSDLYRMNCQGCHGESGEGAPPEINSVINPVRATSVYLVLARMKVSGMEISRPDAVKLAQQSKAALLQRLHNGGENMPPFPHLNEAEVNSLFAYLKQLAAVPGAEQEQLAVKESRIRVGEHIVRSTCHTCHAATGPDPDPQQIWDGAIPPLSTLTTRKSRPEFIRKVTRGAPVLMGASPMLYRGRMPVFYYLSEEEAADVYLYLTLYPPSQSAGPTTIAALTQPVSAGGGTPPMNGSASSVPDDKVPDVQSQSEANDHQMILVLTGVGSFVLLLLVGGLGFTIHEFQRLSSARPLSSRTVKTKPKRRTKDATATLQRVL
jgi:mono/diheme cytochrome c family protein